MPESDGQLAISKILDAHFPICRPAPSLCFRNEWIYRTLKKSIATADLEQPRSKGKAKSADNAQNTLECCRLGKLTTEPPVPPVLPLLFELVALTGLSGSSTTIRLMSMIH